MRVAAIVAAVLAALLLGAVWWLYTPDESRAALDAKYLDGSDSFLEVAGVTLHVRDTGKRTGRTVILLHGFGSSLQTWEGWAGRLDAEYRVIRFDLPGFGLTGADPTGDYSDARAVQVLLALMDRLGVGQANLIGNSLGGKLAWRFAVAHPERLETLVLVSPDGFASPGFAYGQRPSVPAMMRLLPYVLPQPMLRMSLAPAYGDPARLADATVARYRDMMLAPGVRGAIVARMGQVMLEDPVPLLRRIRAPALILWGEKDGMIPFSNAADYVAAIPRARLVALPGLGHVPFEEAPEQSVGPVLDFLGSEGSASAR